MTSALPGQDGAKSSFKHLYNLLLCFTSLLAGKDGKTLPVPGKLVERGMMDCKGDLALWCLPILLPLSVGFLQLGVFNGLGYFRHREPLGIPANASAELEGYTNASQAWNCQIFRGKYPKNILIHPGLGFSLGVGWSAAIQDGYLICFQDCPRASGQSWVSEGIIQVQFPGVTKEQTKKQRGFGI